MQPVCQSRGFRKGTRRRFSLASEAERVRLRCGRVRESGNVMTKVAKAANIAIHPLGDLGDLANQIWRPRQLYLARSPSETLHLTESTRRRKVNSERVSRRGFVGTVE